MSASKRIAFGVTVSWLSRAITILANLFLIPILFRYMGKETLGLWFLLGNSQAFLSLLGIGIAPTLTRQIALAKGRSGVDPDVELTKESKQNIGDLIVTGRIILQWLALGVFFVAWGSGYVLINQLELQQVSPWTVFYAWTLLCASYAIGIWVEYLNCLLIGTGHVGWNNVASTILTVLTILINILAVILGGGLVALAAISAATSLIQRFALLGFIRWHKPELLDIHHQGKWNTKLARSLIKPSLNCWLTTIGAFLILRTDQYFIAITSGTQQIPAYHAAYQLVSNLRVLAISLALSSAPFIGQMWQAGNLKRMHELVIKICRLALLLMGSGISFLLFSGEEVINLWLGEDSFIGYKILLTFCIMLTFEVQNACLITSARATGKEDYAISALAAGILNIILTIIFIRLFGLWGVSLATLLALMFTDNWYALYKTLSRLKFNYFDYLTKVIFVCFLFFCVNIFSIFLVRQLLEISDLHNYLLQLSTTAVTSILVFCIGVWAIILNLKQKKKFIVKVKLLLGLC